MATLPRLKPRTFYDLVVEVALIRPGPIQGGSVHPYIRRRNGTEPVTYLHPLLEPVAEQDARRAAVPGAAHADGDRRRRLHRRARPTSCARRWARSAAASAWSACASACTTGMAERGITGDIADQIYEKLAAFANFGFPESHSVSLRLPRLRQSSWLKLLLSRGVLRGVAQRAADGLLLAAHRSCRTPAATASRCARRTSMRQREATLDDAGAVRRRIAPTALRCGSASGTVRSIGADLAEAHRRRRRRPYAVHGGPGAACRRSRCPQLEALATAGAFGCFEARRGA